MQLRHAIILFSLGMIISLASIFVLPQFSYSVTGENSVKDLLSRSELTSITITGESSQKIEPDQLSIILNVQTPPNVMNSTFSYREETVKKVVDSVVSVVGLNQTSIRIGQTTLNPIYGGESTQPGTLFNAYSTVQIKTDANNLAMLSSNLVSAGFRIDNIQISQIKVPINNTISESKVDVSIVFGSSTPSNNLEYYSPSKITVDPGTTVVWANNDSAAHTVTSGQPSIGPTGLFDSALFSPGKTFEYQFNTVGVHDYFCMVHPWMTGTVTVLESDEYTTETKYQININVAIETLPAPLGDAIKAYEEKLITLKNTLESSGISPDSIQNNQVNFNPISYGYGGGQYSLYTTYTQIIIKTNLTNVEIVLKAAKDSGASVENIIMSISDSKIVAIKKVLIQLALEDAMKNAQDILESTGLQIKGIKTIEVNSDPVFQYGGSPVMYRGVNIWPSYDPSYFRIGDASVSVKVEFGIGK